MTEFTCDRCKQTVSTPVGVGTGYGVINDKLHCYDCCGEMDAERMKIEGKISLYLAVSSKNQGKVTNWPGTLSFPCLYNVKTRNWQFTGPDGKPWYGVSMSGESNQIINCRRLKGH